MKSLINRPKQCVGNSLGSGKIYQVIPFGLLKRTTITPKKEQYCQWSECSTIFFRHDSGKRKYCADHTGLSYNKYKKQNGK
jgi:hypothetical protein